MKRPHIDMRLRYLAIVMAGLGFAGLAWALATQRTLLEPVVTTAVDLINGRADYEPPDYGFAVALAVLMAAVTFGALAYHLLTKGATDRRIDRHLRAREAAREPKVAHKLEEQPPLPASPTPLPRLGEEGCDRF